MRSFLTMLGIIIGVASVIILVSLVNAYMSYMTESFASLGTNQISVNMINLSSRSVSVDEMYEFYEEHTDLFDHMTPMVSVSTTVKHNSDTMSSTSVSGVSEDYLAIKDYDLVQGRNIQYSDITSRQKVCVIGYYVASELYGSPEKAIDETIKIGGYAITGVVGVVERQDEDDLEDGGTDDFVWLPYSCAVKMARNANINNYTFTIMDLTTASEATALIENFLYETFKDDDLYNVTAMSEMLDSLNSMIAMVSAGLGGIAGISLLVAGVGVMNIMLVSVTERTREVGIPESIRSQKKRDLTAACDRGGSAERHGRYHRPHHWKHRDYNRWKTGWLECYANPDGSDRVLQCFCCHWPVLRLYAGKTGGEPESDRCAAERVDLHYHPSGGILWKKRTIWRIF